MMMSQIRSDPLIVLIVNTPVNGLRKLNLCTYIRKSRLAGGNDIYLIVTASGEAHIAVIHVAVPRCVVSSYDS